MYSRLPPVIARRTSLLERFAMPVVTVLLLLAALGTTLAWQEVRHERVNSLERDQTRVDLKARAIGDWVREQQNNREHVLDDNAQVLVGGSSASLEGWLDASVGNDPAGALVGAAITAPNGSYQAVGEAQPGALTGDTIRTQLRELAIATVAADGPRVSGRLSLDDGAAAVAIALPLRARTGGKYGAYLAVYRAATSSIGAFVTAAPSFSPTRFALVDRSGSVISGPHPTGDHGSRIEHDVAGTPWTLLLKRERSTDLLPQWMYPLFAFIMVLLAAIAAWQEQAARVLRRAAAQRARQVRGLLDLSSRMLHANAVERQAEHLARSMIDLMTIDGVCVRFRGADKAMHEQRAGIVDGAAANRCYRIAIVASRGAIGEMVVNRRRGSFEHDERALAQTAASLAGAAMHTIGALETERLATIELQRLDELRSNMLQTVAHELRSPLTTVKGVLGLLSMQRDLGAQNEEYVQLASSRTDALIALIEDLFDCSLLETGQLDIHPELHQASDLVESALGALAAARPADLVLSVEPGLELTVDAVRFDQILNNLVSNAFRHGGVPVRVDLQRADVGHARLVVTDEGPGIPDDERSHIFEKFHQASRGHARQAAGAGLGLALVDGLVRLHGGSISVDSHRPDGRGARFTVIIPLSGAEFSAVA